MTPEEKEGNKLIAEYAGLEFDSSCNAWYKNEKDHEYGLNTEQLKYHTSFDWLMPVARKVHNQLELDYDINPNYGTSNAFNGEAYDHSCNLRFVAGDFNINPLFIAVTGAIKFINKYKNP